MFANSGKDLTAFGGICHDNSVRWLSSGSESGQEAVVGKASSGEQRSKAGTEAEGADGAIALPDAEADHSPVQAAAPELTPEDFAPHGTELVIANPEEELGVFEALDRHDEEQVLMFLQQRAVAEWFYKFPQDGQLVVDLSIKGVFDTVAAMNRTGKCRLRIIPGSLQGATVDEDGQTFYEATVWAEDQVSGAVYSGHSYEPKRKKLKDSTAAKYRKDGKPVGEDNTVWNPFAKTIAVNKAERNALAKFIPQRVRLTLIAQFLNQPGRIREIKAGVGAEQTAELPPPLTDDRARELKERIRAVYLEIREVNRLAVLPGQFNAKLSRAEYEHARLEELLAELESRLEHERSVVAKGDAA